MSQNFIGSSFINQTLGASASLSFIFWKGSLQWYCSHDSLYVGRILMVTTSCSRHLLLSSLVLMFLVWHKFGKSHASYLDARFHICSFIFFMQHSWKWRDEVFTGHITSHIQIIYMAVSVVIIVSYWWLKHCSQTKLWKYREVYLMAETSAWHAWFYVLPLSQGLAISWS